MVIYSGFSHEKWWFSIAMLVHQRVFFNRDRKHKELPTNQKLVRKSSPKPPNMGWAVWLDFFIAQTGIANFPTLKTGIFPFLSSFVHKLRTGYLRKKMPLRVDQSEPQRKQPSSFLSLVDSSDIHSVEWAIGTDPIVITYDIYIHMLIVDPSL